MFFLKGKYLKDRKYNSGIYALMLGEGDEKETNLKTQINVSKAEDDSSYQVSITNLSPAFLVCCKD